MKQNKDKQIEERNCWISFLVAALFIVSLSSAIMYFGDGEMSYVGLRNQLSECQEKVPVWTLKVACYEDLITFSWEKNYTDYEEYLEGRQRVIDFENCEVISE